MGVGGLVDFLHPLSIWMFHTMGVVFYGNTMPVNFMEEITMTKKERNDYLYAKLMESRERNPKHYGLSIIGATYEDVRRYANSKECILDELKEKVRNLSIRIKEVASMYSITSAEVKEYFAFHNYSLSF